MKRSKKLYDVILIVSLLLICAISISALLIFRKEGKSVLIEVDGKIVAVYSLSKSGEYTLNGGSNILIIKDGAAYIKEADCPDKTCVRRGKISHSGESAVCLPNRVSVRVTGNDPYAVDIVS